MNDLSLVRMANQIATNVKLVSADPEEAVANHLRRFWTPSMRQRLAEIAREEPESLDAVVVDVATSEILQH